MKLSAKNLHSITGCPGRRKLFSVLTGLLFLTLGLSLGLLPPLKGWLIAQQYVRNAAPGRVEGGRGTTVMGDAIDDAIASMKNEGS